MLKLNKDILFLIFQELKDDRKSIYSCLLINKLWCETVVPILWRNPLKYSRSKDIEKRSKREKLLFRIILLHLPESSRNLLMSEGINVIPGQAQNLLFDYISFCKYICHVHMFHDVYNTFNLTSFQKIILKKEVIKVFICKCSAIKYLSSSEISEHSIFTFPGANICLSKLKKLRCVSSDNAPFFYGLAQICRSIEKISIFLYDSNPGINHLIEMQKQVKYLKIMVDDDNLFKKNEKIDERRDENDMNKHRRIVQALAKHSHSILYFESWFDKSFPFFIFPKLINLQTLILNNDLFIEQNLFEDQLLMAVFPKLQVLELGEISLYMATRIIENTSGNLWKCRIQGDINFNHSREYIQAIYKYCPNIEYVSIFVNNQNLDELETFLTRCKKLKGIDVQIEIPRVDDDKFFDILVRLSPISLYKIKIEIIYFTLSSLDLFFHNWKGRKSLCLYFLIWDIKEVLDLIEMYRMEGIIKSYTCREFWDIDNYKEFKWTD